MEQPNRDFIENSSEIIFAHDREGRFISFSPGAEQVTGYPRAEALNLSIFDIVVSEHVERARELISRTLNGQLPASAWEFDIIAKDGRRRTVEVRSSPVIAHGIVTGVQGIA